jgi:MYXO-CTERM domain-containing protein
MKKPMVTGLLTFCLSALPLGGVASAQQGGGGNYPAQAEHQAEQTAHDIGNNVSNGGGGNWGWLGLIGLAGLAGLAGRRHADESHAAPHGFRRDEPLGSR